MMANVEMIDTVHHKIEVFKLLQLVATRHPQGNEVHEATIPSHQRGQVHIPSLVFIILLGILGYQW